MRQCKYKSEIFGSQCSLESETNEDYCFWHLKIDKKVLTTDRIHQLKNSFKEVSLVDAYLSGVNLQGITLRHAHLEGADLSNANLIGATLFGNFMDHTNLSNADLRNATLIGAKLSKANMQGASLKEAHIKGVNLQEADLRKTDLSNAGLDNVYMFKVDLRYANLSFSRFTNNCTLTDANLQGTNLNSAILLNVNISNVDFQGANLTNIGLYRANLTRVNLRDINLTNAKLVEAKLDQANLQGTNLTNANLQDADLFNANLRGAKLDRTNLQGANLSNADLTEASLMNVYFNSESLLDNTKLIGADLYRSYVDTTTSFRDAILFERSGDKNEKEFNEFYADNYSDKLIVDSKDIEKSEKSKAQIKKEMYEKSYEVYNKLYHFYSSSGDFETARHVHYRREEVYRKLLSERGGIRNKIKSRVFNWLILKQCAGYGDELNRPIMNSIGVIIAFSIIFWIINGVSVSGRSVQLKDYLYLSVISFTGLGFSNIQPDINVPMMQYFVMFEAILGVLNLALIVFIITYQVSR